MPNDTIGYLSLGTASHRPCAKDGRDYTSV
ncbi:hypothetical protein FHS96_004778 [Sphingomonas zeicaulis]